EIDVPDVSEDSFDVLRLRRIGDDPDRFRDIVAEDPDRLFASGNSRDAPAVSCEVGGEYTSQVPRSEDEQRRHPRSLSAGELGAACDGPVRLSTPRDSTRSG